MSMSLKKIINPENKPVFFGVTTTYPRKNKDLQTYVFKQPPNQDVHFICYDKTNIGKILLVEKLDERIFKLTTNNSIYLVYKIF